MHHTSSEKKEYVSVADAAKSLRMKMQSLYNLVNSGVIPHIRSDREKILVCVEECKWSLFWFNYFLTHQPTGRLHLRKQVASQLVSLLRGEIEGAGGTFFHDFEVPAKKHYYQTHWYLFLTHFLAGIGIGCLYYVAVRLWFS